MKTAVILIYIIKFVIIILGLKNFLFAMLLSSLTYIACYETISDFLCMEVNTEQ